MGSGGTWWSGSWADAVVRVRHPFSLSGQIPAGPRAAAWGGRAGAIRGFGGRSVRPISERRRGALGRRTRGGRWRKRRRRVRLWGRIALGPHVCQCWTRRECRIGLPRRRRRAMRRGCETDQATCRLSPFRKRRWRLFVVDIGLVGCPRAIATTRECGERDRSISNGTVWRSSDRA